MGGPSIVSVKMPLVVFALLTYASTQASAAVTPNVTADEKFPLHIVILVPLTGPAKGGSYNTGCMLATEHINANGAVLPAYTLRLSVADTAVSRKPIARNKLQNMMQVCVNLPKAARDFVAIMKSSQSFSKLHLTWA